MWAHWVDMIRLFTQREDIRKESRWRGGKDKFKLKYVEFGNSTEYLSIDYQ